MNIKISSLKNGLSIIFDKSISKMSRGRVADQKLDCNVSVNLYLYKEKLD